MYTLVAEATLHIIDAHALLANSSDRNIQPWARALECREMLESAFYVALKDV